MSNERSFKQTRFYHLVAISFHETEILYKSQLDTCHVCVNDCVKITSLIKQIVKIENRILSNCKSVVQIKKSDLYLSDLSERFLFAIWTHSEKAYNFIKKNKIVAVVGVDCDESDTYLVIESDSNQLIF